MNGPLDDIIQNRGRRGNARQIGQPQIGFAPVNAPVVQFYNMLPRGIPNGQQGQRRVRPSPGV